MKITAYFVKQSIFINSSYDLGCPYLRHLPADNTSAFIVCNIFKPE